MAGSGGGFQSARPDYTAQPGPTQQISEDAGKGQAMHNVGIRDAGGWVGGEEAEEGVVEVKGKAGSPGRDGDGGRGLRLPNVNHTAGIGWDLLPAQILCSILFSLLN